MAGVKVIASLEGTCDLKTKALKALCADLKKDYEDVCDALLEHDVGKNSTALRFKVEGETLELTAVQFSDPYDYDGGGKGTFTAMPRLTALRAPGPPAA